MNIKEYKGLTAKDISEATGLPNPYTDQSKYSLYRQWELMLRDAKKNNLLHLVEKTNIIKSQTLNIQNDKDLGLTRLYEREVIGYTSNLDLNSIPHKVVRENQMVNIYVNKSDIPTNVRTFAFKNNYAYNVIGILTSEKCYFKSRIFKGQEDLGSSYYFNTHRSVVLTILNL